MAERGREHHLGAVGPPSEGTAEVEDLGRGSARQAAMDVTGSREVIILVCILAYIRLQNAPAKNAIVVCIP